MAEFTKERLEEIHAEYSKPNHSKSFSVKDSEIAEMASQLLAGLEQEPVGDVVAWHHPTEERTCDIRLRRHDLAPGPLYAAPQLPQPAVAEKAITQHFDTLALDVAKMVMCDVNRRNEFLGGDVQLLSRIQCRIDEACRAAMLQGAEPVTTTYKSPGDFICMLTGRAKYLREKGEIKSPELLERAAAALQEESVNTPPIPNGWKLVPIDPTKDMLRAGQSVVGFWLNTVHCYSKMLAAAPAAPQQQEVATDNTTQQFESLGLIVTSDERKMELPRCSKHPGTELQVHPFEQLLSYPPQPAMYCPLCKPSVAEWVEWNKKLRAR